MTLSIISDYAEHYTHASNLGSEKIRLFRFTWRKINKTAATRVWFNDATEPVNANELTNLIERCVTEGRSAHGLKHTNDVATERSGRL